MTSVYDKFANILEMVIYEFDNVPVQIGGITIRPRYDLVKDLKTKNLSIWIQDMVKEATKYHIWSNHTIVVVIWDTGMGNWGWIKQE